MHRSLVSFSYRLAFAVRIFQAETASIEAIFEIFTTEFFFLIFLYLSNQVETAADLLSDSFVAVNLQLFQSFNESPVRIVPSHNRSQYLGIQAGSPLFPTDWHTFVGFVQFNPIRWWFSALNCRHSKYSSWNYWLNFLLGFVSTSWTVIGFIKNIDHR